VTIRGKKVKVVGVIKKQGKQMIGGWDFDQSIVILYKFSCNIINELRADPLIMVQGQITLAASVERRSDRAMRAIRKLSPTQDDDFALNDM
jgi:putative ABC transport system permease protein